MKQEIDKATKTVVREVEISGNKFYFNLPKATEVYPISVTGDIERIVPKLPLYNNVIIMAVYDITVNNLLMSNSPKDLKSTKTRYYIAACDNKSGFNVGDKVILGNTEFLSYIEVSSNHRTPSNLKDFIAAAYPELTIGTAAAIDKSRSKIGIRTEKKLTINPVVSSVKSSNPLGQIKELIDSINDVITSVVYYVSPPHQISAIDEEFITYEREL